MRRILRPRMETMNSDPSVPVQPVFTLYTRKLINLVRILSGYLLSRMTRRVIHWGKPISISIEPTNLCNLHCPECPSGTNVLTRPKGFMDIGFYKKIIDSLSPELLYLTLYFQGEPYLHPLFPEMVKYAKSKKIIVGSSTNGHFLDPDHARATIRSGLDRLIISIDGTDQESYGVYRVNGSLNRVITGVKELVRARKEMQSQTPIIILQFLVLKTNQHQVSGIRRLAREIGVDRTEIKSAQFREFEHGNPLMPDIPRYSRYKKVPGDNSALPSYKIRNRLPRHCFRMWSACVITWEGRVVPCCFDKDAQHASGNLAEKSFPETWNNKESQTFRGEILKNREMIDICRNCTEGTGISAWF
jgi:radical SAM protein with 4Fe4S-binding SPASM domain